jgi:hypothetical protein
VTGRWINLHSVKPCNLYSSPNIIKVIKSRRVRCAGQDAYIREIYIEVWSEYLKERDHFENLGVDGRIT